MQFYLFNIRP